MYGTWRSSKRAVAAWQAGVTGKAIQGQEEQLKLMLRACMVCVEQVFTSHKTNYTLGSIVVGLGLGGSSHWWKTKHNQHHATPNKMSHDDKTAVDPDIDTVPLIAWSEALLRQVGCWVFLGIHIRNRVQQVPPVYRPRWSCIRRPFVRDCIVGVEDPPEGGL